MHEVPDVTVGRPLPHGHDHIAASIFASSLILGAAIVISAELMKPERYEFHPNETPSSYVIYDRDTGRATNSEFDSKNPIEALTK